MASASVTTLGAGVGVTVDGDAGVDVGGCDSVGYEVPGEGVIIDGVGAGVAINGEDDTFA